MAPVPPVCLIAAVARNRVIGRDNRIPWRLPEDLKHFRKLTLGHAVIMGRKTFESILAFSGKPLPGRDNIVITRSREWSGSGCRIAHSLEEAIAAVPERRDAFVIGGAEIYSLALPAASRLYLTEIARDFAGDAFFPEFDRSRWQEVSRERGASGAPDGFDYAFVEYVRSREPRAAESR
ncbi:MAG: dihydrofolate reductase [Burkholderiales bacterium]